MSRFDPLSDLDFEELAADLMRAETGLPFRAGTRGRDAGIDVLAVQKGKRHVVQCKHARTGDARSVIRDATKEADKLAKRKPQPRWTSYRFVTSMRLSHNRREEIAKILSPWIRDVNDVYDERSLEKLLRDHPEVEARHVKLWLASAGTLSAALNAGIYERSRALLDETRMALPRYVQTDAFLRAREVLHEHGVVVVAGPPGVGKTTLARLLMIDGLEQHYEPIDIPQGGLSDAWDLHVPGKRRLFFYDDFLGRISVSPESEDDQVLLRFMRRIAGSTTSRMVLTTREYVLRQAQQLSEVLERESSDLHRFLLRVEDYGREEKARIFYNHIYFSGQVTAKARRALLIDRAYRKIIDHPNYSPRLVEWMTGLAGDRLDDDSRANYASYCLDVLRNPKQLWRRAFDRGVDEAGRALLLCVASLPDGVTVPVLETAFGTACRAREIATQNQRFTKTLQVLDDSFITTARYGSTSIVHAHNPSLLDFLSAYVRASLADAEIVLAGAGYLEQVLWVWSTLTAPPRGSRAPRLLPEGIAPAFAAAFAATLDSVVPQGGAAPRLMMFRHEQLGSSTERLALLLNYVELSPALAEHLRPWLLQRAGIWIDELDAKSVKYAELRIVRRLGKLDIIDLGATVAALIPALDDASGTVNRWSLIAEAYSMAPAVFTAADWKQRQSDFEEDLDSILDEAGGYFEDMPELDEFESVAALMGVEVGESRFWDARQAVEESVAEREAEDGYDQEPDYDPDDVRDLRGGGDDDAAIDAMFERLIDD